MGENVIVTIFGVNVTVDPVAFHIGSFSVYWYGVIIGAAILAAMIYATRRAADFGLKLDPLFDVVIVGLIGAVIGARGYYVLFNFDLYKDDLSKIFAIHDGGLAIYGGVIGSVLFSAVMCRIRKVKIAPAFDMFGIGLFLGQSVGRWGNFINQEAFGTNTSMPWGMYSQSTYDYLHSHVKALAKQGITVDPLSPVHPTFLYESLWCLVGFLFLHFYSKKRKFDGEIILMYAAWYGLGRFFIEGHRTDSLYLFNTGIRVSQLVAAITCLAAVIAIAVVRSRVKARKDAVSYQGVFGEESQPEVTTVMGRALDGESETGVESESAQTQTGHTEEDNG